MQRWFQTACVLAVAVTVLAFGSVDGKDWPQWRGPNRDAHVTGFQAPATWPKELTQQWKIAVGEGVATPALVGDKLYVFSRQGGDEVIRCMEAGSGKEVWQDKYPAEQVKGPAMGFSGPRASPAVSDGKVVTLGVAGTLMCHDAASGKMLWRKDDIKGWPRFYTSSSPMIIDGLVIAQMGGPKEGALVAYDLASGDEKWKTSGDSPAYSSPVVMHVGGAKLIIAMNEAKLVACNAADGKEVWEAPFKAPGGGYNAATPLVDGQTMYYTGSRRGVTAVQFEKEGDKITAKELWKNPDKSVQFNTPVIRDGLLYGITQGNELFCLNAKDGKDAWSAPLGQPNRSGTPGKMERATPAKGTQPGQGGGGRRGGRMGGGGGYGSVVDAGPVLFALTPRAEFVVFEPGAKEFKQIAKYKVSEKETHAYPIVAGNHLYIKDTDSLISFDIR